MGLFDTKKSTTINETTTNFYDQRSVSDAGGGIVGTGNRQSSVVKITGGDPATVKAGSDTVKFLARMGRDTLRDMGESVTDVYSRAGSNQLTAWQSTLNASRDVLRETLAASGRQTDAAQAIAQAAMSSYQPAENQAQAVSLKLGMIAAAGVAVLFLMKKG